MQSVYSKIQVNPPDLERMIKDFRTKGEKELKIENQPENVEVSCKSHVYYTSNFNYIDEGMKPLEAGSHFVSNQKDDDDQSNQIYINPHQYY